MPQPSKSRFIVVRCQEAPNNHNKSVCVPRSWVQCELSETKVSIAYPPEDISRIATRINLEEPANGAWRQYLGYIEYEAESYEDAIVGYMSKIGNRNNVQHIKDKNSKMEPAAKQKDSLKLRIVVPKKPEKKKRSLKKHLKDHTKHKNHRSKHKRDGKRLLKENECMNVVTNTETTSDVTVVAKKSTPCMPKTNCENIAGSSQRTLESRMEDIILGSVQQSLNQGHNNNNTDTLIKDLELDKDIDLTNTIITPEDKKILETIQNDQKNTLGYIRGILMSVKELYLKLVDNKKTLNSILLKYEKQPPPVLIQAITQNVHAFAEENQQNGPAYEEEIQQNGHALEEEIQQNGHAFEEEKQYNGHALKEEKQHNGHAFKEEKQDNGHAVKEEKQHNGHASEEEKQHNGHVSEDENEMTDDMDALRFDEEMESEDEIKLQVHVHDNTMNITEEDNLLVETDAQLENEDTDTEMNPNISDFERFIDDDEESSLDSLPSTPSPPKIKRKKKNIKRTDSSKTLKHRKPGIGLVVIGNPRDPVYVNVVGSHLASTSPDDKR